MDETLRILELAWRRSGTVEDEERYLRERLRRGDIDEARLRLAASMGHEAARRLTGTETAPGALYLLADVTHPARGAAAVAVAKALLPFYEEYEGVNGAGSAKVKERVAALRAGIAACEAWVACPCDEHARGLQVLDAIALNDCVPECCWDGDEFAAYGVALPLRAVAACAGRDVMGWAYVRETSELLTRNLEGMLIDPEPWREAAEQAIRAAVIPWALGAT